MNQVPQEEKPEPEPLSAEAVEGLARDFFLREMLPKLEEVEEEDLVGEGAIEFARFAAPKGFVLTAESGAGAYRVLHACAREHTKLQLPSFDTGDTTAAKPSKKRKAVLKPDSLLTVQQVMDRIQMSENFVYGLIQKGHLKAVMLSKRAIRIYPYAVEEYLKSRPLPTR